MALRSCRFARIEVPDGDPERYSASGRDGAGNHRLWCRHPLPAGRDASGLAAVLNELATASNTGMEFDEMHVPVRREVQAACEMLGLDPLFIANEGKMVCIVRQQDADLALSAMRSSPFGKEAALIGRVVHEHPAWSSHAHRSEANGWLICAGELLPRIC